MTSRRREVSVSICLSVGVALLCGGCSRGDAVKREPAGEVMIGRTEPVTSSAPNRPRSPLDGRWYVMGYSSQKNPEFAWRPGPMGGLGPLLDVTHEGVTYNNYGDRTEVKGPETTGTDSTGAPWIKVAGETAEARLSLQDGRLIVEVVSTAGGARGPYLLRAICRGLADAEGQMRSVRGGILKETGAAQTLARARWSDLK